MSDNEPIRDEVLSMEALGIVERYETFVHYVYGIIIGFSRAHTVLRDRFMAAVLKQTELFNDAGKSGQISRLYLADSGLASLRSYLRLAVHLRLLSKNQHRVASIHLAETGRMLGAWIKRVQGQARKR